MLESRAALAMARVKHVLVSRQASFEARLDTHAGNMAKAADLYSGWDAAAAADITVPVPGPVNYLISEPASVGNFMIADTASAASWPCGLRAGGLDPACWCGGSSATILTARSGPSPSKVPGLTPARPPVTDS